MTNGRRDSKLRTLSATPLLCGLILVITSSAGLMTYRFGRDSLLESIEEQLIQKLRHARGSTEGTLLRLVENMESWARQPVMARVLDADPDHDIAELADTLVLGSSIFRELTCSDTLGQIVASSNTEWLGKRMELSESDPLDRLRGGCGSC